MTAALDAAAIQDRFAVHPARGFLPEHDPLRRLPAEFDAWEQLAGELPKLLVTDQTRQRVKSMPELDPTPLNSDADRERKLDRAMLLLSYIGHAYVWGEGADEVNAAQSIPANLARPWHAVSEMLGRPPILSYASYALHNWYRPDPDRKIEVGNIALLQNFWGGADEEWFVLIHVAIEYQATGALTNLIPAQEAAAREDWPALTNHLRQIADSCDEMYKTLCDMPIMCDPHTYFRRVRPYIFGWKNNPALPNGMTYEGVDAYDGKGQLFRGETGAQSSIVPALDAVLNVEHAPDPLRDYLMEMRNYMPPKHRAFIAHLENNHPIRPAVERLGNAELTEQFDRCAKRLADFRAKHYEYAASYIHKQADQNQANPSDIGTGGTPFMKYLKKHLDETTASTPAT